MSKLWFAAKRYGYGWYPVTWEGWAVMGVYAVLLLLPVTVSGILQSQELSDQEFTVFYVPYALVLTVILIFISAKKGEKARWRWGK